MADEAQGTEVVKAEDVEAGRGQLPAESQDRSQLPDGMLEPVADPGELVQARTKRSELIADALEEGRDYGSVPGIPKPFLHKPGAERLTDAFGCYPRFTVEDQEIDHDREVEWEKQNGKSGESVGLYRYRVSCDLVHRASGIVVGNGLGACSTMEDKYVESPRNAENTALKMAKKRAHVDAALSTFGLSEMFTQDADYVKASGQTEATGPVLERPVPRGKHKGTTWGELVEEDPGYVEWALGETDWLEGDEAVTVREAMAGPEDDAPDTDRRADLKAELWRTFGSYIQDDDMRLRYLKSFAAHYVDYPDTLADWTAEDFERAVEHVEEEGMVAALKDLEPEKEAQDG